MPTTRSMIADAPVIRVVDGGASDIDGPQPYQRLLAEGRASVVGFEPDPGQLAKLHSLRRPNAVYLPDALGDGTERTLHVCRAPGMTSLFEPDAEMLSHFHGFPKWGEVVDRRPCPTRRLDDVPEARGADFLKLDVQGAELLVLESGRECLASVVVVQTEVQFVPFYRGQPLFADVDAWLREAGFQLHRFLPIHSRVLRPMVLDDDVYAGLSQVLWTDAVYVRPFTEFDRLEPDALLRIATIVHEFYGSFDLAALALGRIDARDGGTRQRDYVARLGAADGETPSTS